VVQLFGYSGWPGLADAKNQQVVNTFTAGYLKIWLDLNARFFKAVYQFFAPLSEQNDYEKSTAEKYLKFSAYL
jgi:hypothetical protein